MYGKSQIFMMRVIHFLSQEKSVQGGFLFPTDKMRDDFMKGISNTLKRRKIKHSLDGKKKEIKVGETVAVFITKGDKKDGKLRK